MTEQIDRDEEVRLHNEGACDQDCALHQGDVHVWFELSYANFLVWPRSVLQAMPGAWQRRFVALAEELDAALEEAGLQLDPPGGYSIQAKGAGHRFISNPLADYRYAPRSLEALAEKVRWEE